MINHATPIRVSSSVAKKTKEEIEKYSKDFSESAFIRIAIKNYIKKIKDENPATEKSSEPLGDCIAES
jgi:hypothetical protein